MEEKLIIETPEQTVLDFAIAGVGSRFLAIAFDTLIQLGAAIVVGIGGVFAIRGVARLAPMAGLWGGAALLLLYFLLYFGYFAFFEIIWNGQTPGKRKVGIRVIKDSGRPLSPAESIARNLMRIVDWLPLLYGLGVVSALATRETKRLGDLVVGSLVVRETSLSNLRAGWQAPAAISSTLAAPLGASQLSTDEVSLVDSYLTRRLDLDPTLRFRMADEILKRIAPKLTLPSDQSLSSDKILEAVAYERRTTGHYS
jgi:uncharacterized RDD family membrane protein YckC